MLLILCLAASQLFSRLNFVSLCHFRIDFGSTIKTSPNTIEFSQRTEDASLHLIDIVIELVGTFYEFEWSELMASCTQQICFLWKRILMSRSLVPCLSRFFILIIFIFIRIFLVYLKPAFEEAVNLSFFGRYSASHQITYLEAYQIWRTYPTCQADQLFIVKPLRNRQ